MSATSEPEWRRISLMALMALMAFTDSGIAAAPAITVLNPPEKGFFSKVLDFHGIPIKAHQVVADEALHAAYDRLWTQLQHQPAVIANLAAAHAELHIIGRNQVTTDLPEWQHDKGKPIPEY